MSFSVVVACAAIGILAVICVLMAWAIKPAHVGVGFSGAPPVVARINAPKGGATEKSRTMELPGGEIYVVPERAAGHFLLVHAWPVKLTVDGVDIELTVPKRFHTDFASVPWYLHSLVSPLNNTVYAAIVHDYLYRSDNQPQARSIDRATADRIFYWCMRAKGVSRVTSGAMYVGVRLGGRQSYLRP